MKNNLNKFLKRYVTGLLTITVLGACGQNTKDTTVNDVNKKQVTKTEMGSQTKSLQLQNRNVSYTEKKTNSGHHYGQIKQFDREALEVVQNYAKELGFNAIFTLDEDGIIMDIPSDYGNWHPEEMVQKIMEVYGMEKRPDIAEVVEGGNTWLIYTKVSIQQEIQAKINELGLEGSSTYKRYGINEIYVFSYRWSEVDNYQVKMEELFKYIEEKVRRPITVDLWHDDSFNKYYSVKW